jgi:hypothetical protein
VTSAGGSYPAIAALRLRIPRCVVGRIALSVQVPLTYGPRFGAGLPFASLIVNTSFSAIVLLPQIGTSLPPSVRLKFVLACLVYNSRTTRICQVTLNHIFQLA